jgi:hypothetical protein
VLEKPDDERQVAFHRCIVQCRRPARVRDVHDYVRAGHQVVLVRAFKREVDQVPLRSKRPEDCEWPQSGERVNGLRKAASEWCTRVDCACFGLRRL